MKKKKKKKKIFTHLLNIKYIFFYNNKYIIIFSFNIYIIQ